MWQPEDVQGDARGDVTWELARHADVLRAHDDLFDRAAPLLVARAPGRLDLMGGIADYSGSLVLQLPLAAATLVCAQASDDGHVTVRSPGVAAIDAAPEVSIPLATLAPGGVWLDYDEARALLAADPRRQWAAYVVGALVVLGCERGMHAEHGLRLLVDSTVPAGKGVSSSAALEVAAMQAVCAAYAVTLSPRELALLCQLVENRIVGAPCGVMDQMTSACGEAHRLLALRCQPAEVEGQVPLPPDLTVWGIDSGIRHAVGGTDYQAVRVGAFMGYRIVADLAGLPVERVAEGRVVIDDARWGGYLANVGPAEWQAAYRDRVPVALDGATFLARYDGTTDMATRVHPARTYAVRQPTAHPIYEHDRVQRFRAALAEPAPDVSRRRLGAMMYASHDSYGACGLGSDGTDRLVALVRASDPAAGLLGAKITGGGSGGVVAVLAQRGAEQALAAVTASYTQQTGRAATLLGGSSPGAAAFGVRRLRWATPSTDVGSPAARSRAS